MAADASPNDGRAAGAPGPAPAAPPRSRGIPIPVWLPAGLALVFLAGFLGWIIAGSSAPSAAPAPVGV
ncbi:MAG: hypothetical protein M0Z42_22130, partial [Actinomycetota bacterium]|nr:hypothetical protein [Actinomycetota bacterium]